MKEKAIGKVMGGLLICLMLGLVFGGLIDTTSATSEKTTVSVTDSSPWFTRGTNSGSGPWYPHTYDGHDYISTYVGGMSGNPSQPDCWAEFKPYLSQSGKYEVYAYFYACKDTSTKVPFTVKYDGGSTTIKVNQYRSSPAWKEKYLGTWNFKAGAETYVKVTDATGEPYDGCKGLTIGSTKFVKVETPPGAFTLTGEALCDENSPYNHLSWTASSGVTSYAVYRDGSHYKALQTLGTTFDNTLVTAGTTYTYFVRATNAAGSTDSNTVTVTTKECAKPPGAFTLTGEALCDGDSPYNHLSWTSSSGVTSYAVYRDGSHYKDLQTLGTTFDNTLVTAGTTHTYFVRATNAAGSTDSNTVTVTTKECAKPPGAFTLTGEALCDGDSPYNHLSWTSSSGVTSYAVYRDGSHYKALQTLGTTFDNTLVTAGTTHTYFVRATNAAGSTDSNTVTVTTKECAKPPGAFTLTVEALCDGDSPYNHLSWTSSSGVTSYAVYRDGSHYKDLQTLGTTFDNTLVTAGTTYTYFVRATNAAGSTDSNTVTVTARSDCGIPEDTFNRQSAYNYAQKYAYRVCSDGYFFEASYPPSYLGAETPVPSECGFDCAHFVSCCIGAETHEQGGGLDVPSRTEAYGEPGADKLRKWLIDSGNAMYETTIGELEKGDVISYDLEGDGYFDHVVLYLGSGKIAAHSVSYWNVNWDVYKQNHPNFNYKLIHIKGGEQQLICAIELQKNGIPIDKVNAGQFFDIYVGDSSGSIAQVRFLIDENQNDIVDEGFTWTEWYNWDISSGDWNAETKIMRWAFHIEGRKEVWAEVKDGDGQTRNCFANIVTENLYWLAKAIMSEASVGTPEERIAVGWTALNRLDSNEFPSTIKQVVESGYAHNQEPTQEIIDLSKDILERKYSDPTGGATYFFSPRSMTSGYGPYEISGTNKKSLIPSWAIPKGYSKTSPPSSDWEMTEFYKTIENLEWVSGLVNIRNWYFMFYCPISSPAAAKPVLTSPLKITPEKDKYFVGDTLTAEFTITNMGTKPITFDKLTVGGRLNGYCPDDKCPDFTFRSTTLQPNVPYQYTGTFTLTHSGNYHFFIAYYVENPTPEEKKLLDENKWNTCVDLGEGLTHTNRIKNIIVLKKEIPPPGTISEYRSRINHNLQQQVKYSPYLPDPNSFTSAVATTWAKFTSWVTQTHLTERYDELYQTGIDYDCLSFKALKNARDSLDRGDMVSAEKYLQKSYTYEMLSAMSFGAAAEVFDDNLEAGEILAKGIKDGCEASVKFGLAITNPEAAKAADYLYIGVDYAVDRALVGKEEAAKNAIVKTAVTTIFNEIKFKDLGDKTIADYTENKIGKVTFPMLQKAFKNNEQIQFALSKIIKESGVEIEEEAAEYILSYILDELEKTVNLKQSEVKSPVELRVYDSRGEATGLLNGEVGHGIPRSVYCDGTVTILFPLDTYRYEVIGTGTGTYKLGLTSIKDGEVINFTATDIPTSTNAIHQYTIDWDVLSQAEEGVTVKIDSDGDGIFEKTVTADNELSQEEYSTSTLPPLPPEPNQPPTLSDGYVTPASGDTSTIFNYYVTYKDPNGDAPIIKYVYIDGSSHTMTKIGGDYTSGARFKYSTTLSAGSHNYYFYFDDGHGHTVRLPTLGAYPGPTILTPTLPPSPSPSPKPNQPPTLSSGYVTPPSGDTSTIFNYYVTYKDPDGDAPAWHVVIKGAPPGLGGLSDHIMTKISGDYKSGAVFKYSTTLPALPAGYNYQYNFYFDDGHSHTVVYPDTEMFQGPTVVLPNQPPTLSNFSAGGQGQIGDFYITYTDPDGDTPTIKYVYIDGSPHTMTKISGDYISGAKFKYSTTLSVDEEHNFYYYFEDGHGHSVRWPASETIVIIPIPPPPPKP